VVAGVSAFLVIALAVIGTLAIFFLGEIFMAMIVVALAVFYAALMLSEQSPSVFLKLPQLW
jgi:hypothetical protein